MLRQSRILGTYVYITDPPLWKNRTLAWHIRGLTLASVRPLRPVLEDLGVRGSLGPSPALAHHRGFSHRGSQRLVGDALKSKGRMVDQGDRPIKRCVPGVHSASIDFVSATRRSRSSKSAIFGSFCGLKGRKVRTVTVTVAKSEKRPSRALRRCFFELVLAVTEGQRVGSRPSVRLEEGLPWLTGLPLRSPNSPLLGSQGGACDILEGGEERVTKSCRR